jgi:choice-of-anchor A domain-containing protein
MAYKQTRIVALAIVGVLVLPLVASALVVNLGGAANYAVLGIGGTGSSAKSDFQVYQSGTVINGNVGMGPYSVWTHGLDCTVNGRIDYDTTDLAPYGVTGTVSGGIHQIPMAGIVADAVNASATAAALAPTQTLATLSEDQTIVGNGGLNVIRVTGAVTLKKTFKLQGTPSDKFVFQLTSTGKDPLVLSGVLMSLTGGVTADNVLWNLSGAGGDVSISSGECTVYGTFLAPYRNVLVDNADVFGQVIGGGGAGNYLSIHSTSSVTLVPEPATVALLVFSGLIMLRRRMA